MIYGPLSEALLDGRYRVGEILGEGGFGTVYAATHLGLSAKVAIKIPRVDGLAPKDIPEAVARFMEEGRTLKRLRHPSLVAALDVALLPVNDDGLTLPYLVLEWCDGPTLAEWRDARPGPLPFAEAWALLRPAFAAIAHAHAESIAHRDIKPRNILVEEPAPGRWVPRVIDFGIAKLVLGSEEGGSGATRTTSAERAYTPRYAAPEQHMGLRTGVRTDVYSLALVLIETIRGTPVYETDDAAREAMLRTDLPTVAKLGLDLGSHDAAVDRALAPKPAERWADAGEFMDALDGAAARPQPGFDPGAAARVATTPDRPADDTVAPSSHTLRTVSATRGSKPPTTARRARVGWMLGVAAATAVAALGVATYRFDGTATASGPVASDSGPSPPSSPAGKEEEARPLAGLRGSELLLRGGNGGLTGCHLVSESAILLQMKCDVGHVTLQDFRNGFGPPRGIVPLILMSQAKEIGASGFAARYAVDGNWGVMIAAPHALIDDLATRVLSGTRHDPLATEATPPEAVAIPERLSQWSGRVVAARLEAIGATMLGVQEGIDETSLYFQLDGAEGMTTILENEPSKLLAGREAPLAYATETTHALIVRGDWPNGPMAVMTKILAATHADKTGQLRSTP